MAQTKPLLFGMSCVLLELRFVPTRKNVSFYVRLKVGEFVPRRNNCFTDSDFCRSSPASCFTHMGVDPKVRDTWDDHSGNYKKADISIMGQVPHVHLRGILINSHMGVPVF